MWCYTREETKDRARDFLLQAKEFLSSALDYLNKSRPNGAGFDAIQAMINSNDALTIHFLGKRASKDHREATGLHVDVVKIIHDDSGRAIIKEALDKRSGVGYVGKKISISDAKSIVDKAIKFVGWVEKTISS